MARDPALRPLRQGRARQIRLRKIVEAKDRSYSAADVLAKGWSPHPPAWPSTVSRVGQRSKVLSMSRSTAPASVISAAKYEYDARAMLHSSSVRWAASSVLDVGKRERRARIAQFPHHVFGDGSERPGHHDGSAAEVDTNHLWATLCVTSSGPRESCDSTSCPLSVTSTSSSIRAPPPYSET